MGIIPRIAGDIFDHIYSMDENLEFHIKVLPRPPATPLLSPAWPAAPSPAPLWSRCPTLKSTWTRSETCWTVRGRLAATAANQRRPDNGGGSGRDHASWGEDLEVAGPSEAQPIPEPHAGPAPLTCCCGFLLFLLLSYLMKMVYLPVSKTNLAVHEDKNRVPYVKVGPGPWPRPPPAAAAVTRRQLPVRAARSASSLVRRR